MQTKIMQYDPKIRITNTEQLPRGTGAKYLEVIQSHIDMTNDTIPYIAKAWHRKLPNRAGIFLKFD
jgi:hypothetical protein